MIVVQNQVFLPQILPQMGSGKNTTRIVLRKDKLDREGKGALLLYMYDGKIKRKPIDIRVKPEHFDKKAELVKKGDKSAEDYNLIIGQLKARINEISVQYRLQKTNLTNDILLKELDNPSSRINFQVYAKQLLESQKGVIKDSTIKQQQSTLRKIKKYKPELRFSDITEDWVTKFRGYLKTTLKNKPATVEGTIKNFKKIITAANKQGIITPLKSTDIKNKKIKGNRQFLEPESVKKLLEYYESNFINDSYKHILSWFLFCCFTGIRFGDLKNLSENNIVGDFLVLFMGKTEKPIQIRLNKRAQQMLKQEDFYKNKFTDQYINRELKKIISLLGIKKHITFHCSRHTFATCFLIAGGRVEQLQVLLGHSAISETMIYVHIVNQYTDKQIDLMEDLFI